MGAAFGGRQEAQSTTQISRQLREPSRYALGEARNLYDNQQPLPSTYTPMSGQREEALNSMYNTSRDSQIASSGIGEWQKVMSGQYLDPSSNPWLEDVVNRSVSASQGSQVSQYAGAGRFGGGAMANAVQDAGQSTASRIYGQNYMNERNNMMSALGMTGNFQELQYADDRITGQIGLQYEQEDAERKQEEMRQYMNPYMQLQQYQGFLTSNPLMGESVTDSVQKQPFQWGQALMGGIGGLLNPMKGMMGGGE
jgi:hypothetical protein